MLAQPVETDNSDAQANHYASHLAEVNQKQEVVATEDIRSQNGMTLIKKGMRINAEAAQRLLQHKLLKPIEAQVKLEHTFNSDSLLAHFDTLFEKYADLDLIRQAHAQQFDLAGLLSHMQLNSILYQKLTVLAERLPEVFDKALFCRFDKRLFPRFDALANACDEWIGSPDIIYKKGDLTQDEWRAIQSHVVIGYLIFKESDVANQEVARAILEHHECCDGTGYPKAKSADQLCMLGQILGMADSIQAVRINRFQGSGRNLYDVLPFLHMNSSKHFLTIYKTVCLIILKSHIPQYRGNPYADYQTLLATLLERVDKLQDAVVVLQLISDLTATRSVTEQYVRYARVINPVIFMIRSSGMVRDELILWLKKLKLNENLAALRELNELDLMQMELLWQLKMVVRVINAYIDDAKVLSVDQRQHLQKLSEYLHESVTEPH